MESKNNGKSNKRTKQNNKHVESYIRPGAAIPAITIDPSLFDLNTGTVVTSPRLNPNMTYPNLPAIQIKVTKLKHTCDNATKLHDNQSYSELNDLFNLSQSNCMIKSPRKQLKSKLIKIPKLDNMKLHRNNIQNNNKLSPSMPLSQSSDDVLYTAKDMVMTLPLSYLYSRPELRHLAIESACKTVAKTLIKKQYLLLRLVWLKWMQVPNKKRVFQDRKIGLMVLIQALSVLVLKVIRKKFILWAKHYATKYIQYRQKIINHTANRIQLWYKQIRNKLQARIIRQHMRISLHLEHRIQIYQESEKERKRLLRLHIMRMRIVEDKYLYYTTRKIQRMYRYMSHYHTLKRKWIHKNSIRIWIRWRKHLKPIYPKRFLIAHIMSRCGHYTLMKSKIPWKYRKLLFVYSIELCIHRIQRAWNHRNQRLLEITRYQIILNKSAKRIQYCFLASKWRIFMKNVCENNRARRIQRSFRAYQYRYWSWLWIENNKNKKAKIIQQFLKARSLYTHIQYKISLKSMNRILENILYLSRIILIQRTYRYYRTRVHTTHIDAIEKGKKVILLLLSQNDNVLCIQRNWRQSKLRPKNEYHIHVYHAVKNYFLKENRYFYWKAYLVQKVIRLFLKKCRYLRFLLHTKCAKLIQHAYRCHRFTLRFYDRIRARYTAEHLVHGMLQTKYWNRYIQHYRYTKLIQNKNIRKIQKFYRKKRAEYYSDIRIAARYQVEKRKKLHHEETLYQYHTIHAIKIQRWYRHMLHWKYNLQRIEKEKILCRQAIAAHKIIQGTKYHLAKNIAHRLKHEKRIQQEIQRQYEIKTKASRTIQKIWKHYHEQVILYQRFELRKHTLQEIKVLELARQQAERIKEEALYNVARIEENMTHTIASAWKQGSNANGKNYYYNYVTGESRWDPPENWAITMNDQWIRNLDERHNVYYYNMKTGESRWLPPCTKCGLESQRWCTECIMPYCEADYELCHHSYDSSPVMKSHTWSATECAKAILEQGEVYCIECKQNVGIKMCMMCWDAYCDDCFKIIHHTGTLATHRSQPYRKAKKGWVCIKGHLHDEPDYYIHGTTGETTYDKPLELMNEEEKRLHDNFKLHQQVTQDQIKKIEKLQYDLEAVKYERDKVLYDALVSSSSNNNSNTKVNKNAIMASLGITTQSGTNSPSKTTASQVISQATTKKSGLMTMFQGLSSEYRGKILAPPVQTRERNKTRSDYINQLLTDDK